MSKTQLFDLDGKIAFVSGASRGIGEAIAKLLAQQGAHVIVSSRKIDGCQHVADAIIADGGKATAIACHIGEMEQITGVFARIREEFGRLDILVNNAATNPQFCNVLDTDLGAFQKTVDVNIRGYFFMSVEAGKLMREHGGGSIINVASINGVSPGVFARIREEFGRLDILVNNAATNPQFCNVLDTDLGAFQKTVDVNIRGYFFMSVEAGKLMRENGGGSIINVASINGVSPGVFQGIYSVTKAAVINMTKVFAKECAQFGIRCNALLPGLTDTKFASALVKNDAILKQALTQIPLKRVADPSEMAGAVLYLASDASSYTTGVSLNVDGGFLS